MTEIPYREIFKLKQARRATIKELELHAHGAAVHVGQISPGCRVCFTGEQGRLGEGSGVFLGRMCMANCPMCYYHLGAADETSLEMDQTVRHFLRELKSDSYRPYNMAYVSEGETLLYLDKLKVVAKAFNRYEDDRGLKVYHHLYTNGIVASEDVLDILVDLRVDELRFHVSASNFSKDVLQNMRNAKARGITITVEEPSWPLHKQQLIDHLPIFEKIGVKHIDLVEVQLSEHNFDTVSSYYPDGRYYKDYFYHLYDEGMVYDIMEERIKKGYTFSVLDCNSGVEKSRNGVYQQEIGFDMETLNGLMTPFDWETPR